MCSTERSYKGEEEMLNRDSYSQKRPGLKAEDIKARRANLTVQTVEQVELDDDNTEDGKRNALAVTFEEFPDKPYWPNGTSIGFLIDELGEDEEEWAGERIPLEKKKTTNPRTKQLQDSLWVAAPEDWAEFLREGKPGKPASNGRKNVAKKAAAKKQRGR
jgi:hypothetical protein